MNAWCIRFLSVPIIAGKDRIMDKTQPMAEAFWKALTANLPKNLHRNIILAMQVGFVIISTFFKGGTVGSAMAQFSQRYETFLNRPQVRSPSHHQTYRRPYLTRQRRTPLLLLNLIGNPNNTHTAQGRISKSNPPPPRIQHARLRPLLANLFLISPNSLYIVYFNVYIM
jgi:hypothetical protein